MATARQIKAMLGRRRWPWLVLAVLLGLGLWFHTPIMGYARAGAAVGAHVACSCRYIEGRGIEDCKKDFEKGMGLILVSDNPAAKSVTARFPLLSAQTASFREGQGCVIEPWK
ncbi:MAG: hypothetical protein ABIW31_06625 [Novosphingobium sp.]